jgi:hypothetical protein
MLPEIERVAAAREQATPGEWRFNGVNSKPKLFGWMREKDAVFAEGAANLDWPRLVARMRAMEEFITTCSYGWTGPQEGEPFMSFDRDKLGALRAALEAAKEAG